MKVLFQFLWILLHKQFILYSYFQLFCSFVKFICQRKVSFVFTFSNFIFGTCRLVCCFEVDVFKTICWYSFDFRIEFDLPRLKLYKSNVHTNQFGTDRKHITRNQPDDRKEHLYFEVGLVFANMGESFGK